MILYFIFEHFPVLKQVHTLGACRVLEHFTVLKQLHTLGAWRDFKHSTVLNKLLHMSRFGTSSAFVTFLRYDSMINYSYWNIQSCSKHYNLVLLVRIEIKLELFIKNIADEINKGSLYSFFCEFIIDISTNSKNSNIFKFISLYMTADTQTIKTFQKTNWIIHTKSWHSIITNVCFDLNCWLFLNLGLFQKPYFVGKTWQLDMN